MLFVPMLPSHGKVMHDFDSWVRCTGSRVSSMSVEDFRRQYEAPNKPVLLTDVVGGWPAFGKWTKEYLLDTLKGQDIVAGSYDMTFTAFLEYCSSQKDEMPLYLFDKNILKEVPLLAQDYQVPEYFQEDLFALLGDNRRPDYRLE